MVKEMERICAVASGVWEGPLPSPRRWGSGPEGPVPTAGVISTPVHAWFWRHVILPNCGLGAGEVELLSRVISEGVRWEDFARVDAGTGMPARPTIRGKQYDISTVATSVGVAADVWLDSQLEAWEETGVVRYLNEDDAPPTAVAPLLVEPTKPRLIHDLRAQNEYCRERTPKFHYDRLKEFVRDLEPGCLMVGFDLQQGYTHIAIHEDSRCMFGAQWRGRYLEFNALGFGWVSSPYLFQLLMVAVTNVLRRLGLRALIYLDDGALRCFPATETRDVTQRGLDTVFVLCELFFLAGLWLHPRKSQLTPSTSLKSLGFVIDSSAMTFRIPDEKVVALMSLCRQLVEEEWVLPQSVARVVGKASSLALAAPCIQMFLAPLRQLAQRPPGQADGLGRVRLSDEQRDALLTLSEDNLRLWQRVARWVPESHQRFTVRSIHAGGAWQRAVAENGGEAPADAPVHVFADASGGRSDGSRASGWGAHVIHPGGKEVAAKGPFHPSEEGLPICVKEAIACVTALEMSGAHDCYLVLHTDNSSVKSALCRYHTSKHDFRIPLMRCVQWQIQNNVALSVEYVPTLQNCVSDLGSRTAGRYKEDSADVMLEKPVTSRLQRWAELVCTVDVCSTLWNRQTEAFVARDASGHPSQVATGCMSFHPPEGAVCWVFPPWSILSPLWGHLEAVGARGILLAPGWAKDQVFWRIREHAAVLRLCVAVRAGEEAFTKPCNSYGGRSEPFSLPYDVWAVLFDFSTR
jgi:hypothetical protein